MAVDEFDQQRVRSEKGSSAFKKVMQDYIVVFRFIGCKKNESLFKMCLS